MKPNSLPNMCRMAQHEPRHCDDYIRDKTQPKCLRKWLLYHRIPATWKYTRWREAWGKPKCFATYKKNRVQLVMASRFGDVGITNDLSSDSGYGTRVGLFMLTDFSENP